MARDVHLREACLSLHNAGRLKLTQVNPGGTHSMQWIRTVSRCALVLLLGTTALAQTPPANQEAFYRCRGANGQTLYGDRVPSGCEGMDTEVLNARGMTLRIIEGEKTRSARLEREAVEAKARQQHNELLQRDRVLNETYLSVADIERLRDQRLDQLVAQYRLTQQNIAGLHDRQSRLEAQIARFKPYNDKPNALPLPDHLAEEMVNTVNGLRVYQETLVKNRDEQAQLTASFAADIKRFKELKGL